MDVPKKLRGTSWHSWALHGSCIKLEHLFSAPWNIARWGHFIIDWPVDVGWVKKTEANRWYQIYLMFEYVIIHFFLGGIPFWPISKDLFLANADTQIRVLRHPTCWRISHQAWTDAGEYHPMMCAIWAFSDHVLQLWFIDETFSNNKFAILMLIHRFLDSLTINFELFFGRMQSTSSLIRGWNRRCKSSGAAMHSWRLWPGVLKGRPGG